MICEKCGQEHLTPHNHPACPGHITSGERKGQPCKNDLGYKTLHAGVGCCFVHGGKTESHNKNAQMQILEREVQQMLGGEYESITDPYTALADVAGRIKRTMEFLQERVEELDSLRSFGGAAAGEQIDVVFAAYERALDRTEKTFVNMARLDLEDRIAKLHTRINTDMANQIMAAMNDTLASVVIEDDLREVIRRGFAARLSGGQQPDSKQTNGSISTH